MKAFSRLHPLVNLIYFVAIIGFSFYFMHPIFVLMSFCGGCLYMCALKGKNAFKFVVLGLLPIMTATALFNPLFNHRGVTILAYFPNGNPLTLESLFFGVVAAGMMGAVVCFFFCVTECFTSEKISYLFGGILPVLSLVVSMTVAFVPKFIKRFGQVRIAQRAVGRDISDGAGIKKVKNAVSIFSIVVTWVFENALQTADSMKARGFGLKKRTTYKIFEFETKDFFVLGTNLIFCGIILYYLIFGGYKFEFFPSITQIKTDIYNILVMCVFGALVLLPGIVELAEGIKWKILKSKI